MKFITAFILFLLSISALAMDVTTIPTTDAEWNEFLDILSEVESNSTDGIVKTDVNGRKSYGRLQIQSGYLRDSGLSYTLEQVRTSKEISYKVAKAYLEKYARIYESLPENAGKRATVEVLARIHNGGPNGWRRSSTIAYLGKVKTKFG